MLDTKLRGLWDRAMKPVGARLGRFLTPNAVTLLALLIQVAVAVAIVQGRLLVAGLVGCVAAVADGVDGAVAKAQGRTSKFGALLDSTVDRVVDALFLIPLAWLYGVSPDIPGRDQPWVAALALFALVASFLVSYVKARAEGLGFEAKVGIAERAERLIIVLLGLLLDLVPVALALLAALSLITFAQRVVHVASQARRAS